MTKKLAWCIFAIAVPVGLLITLSLWHPRGTPTALPEQSGNTSIAPAPIVQELPRVTLSLPIVLSVKDRTLYQAIVRVQKKGDWKKADELIAKLSDKILVGDMLGERYLDPKHKSTVAELTEWLNQYADHPQAYDIYMLALAKSPKLNLPAMRRPAKLQGYGDDTGLARAGETFFGRVWQQAIATWRAGHKAEAARLFSGLVNHKQELSPWQVSAAAYWSWRSYHAAGDKATAKKYLAIAASEPRSFYGILARKQLGKSLELDSQPVKLSDSDILEMIGEPGVRRTVALAQCNLSELAEKELRSQFPLADKEERLRLLALARHLNLASVQISMAKHLDSDSRPLDYAKYPIPRWQPQDGFKVEPALIYAMMRQESGFRTSAVSPVGALGLMQLMPKTATLVHQRINNDLLSNGQPLLVGNVTDPGFNMTLGQNYIRHLLENRLVEGNMFYMLVAYNAGAGRLQSWKQNIDYQNDPLLFVESIPIAETRYYVMQVMTNYWIYSELASKSSPGIDALLGGQWPNYIASEILAGNAG